MKTNINVQVRFSGSGGGGGTEPAGEYTFFMEREMRIMN
jgi:hypothetical protein